MKEIESIRGYYRTNKAWYGKNESEINITFGLYYPDGEMSMVCL